MLLIPGVIVGIVIFLEFAVMCHKIHYIAEWTKRTDHYES